MWMMIGLLVSQIINDSLQINLMVPVELIHSTKLLLNIFVL